MIDIPRGKYLGRRLGDPPKLLQGQIGRARCRPEGKRYFPCPSQPMISGKAKVTVSI
jgi:hypothetical protein